MADQDGRHSDIMWQLLRHVKSSSRDEDVKGDIFTSTIYPQSLVVIAFILPELRKWGRNQEKLVLSLSVSVNLTQTGRRGKERGGEGDSIFNDKPNPF